MKDAEQFLKAGLKEDGDVVLSREQAEKLLARLQDYRKRFNENNTRFARKIAPLHSELGELKRLFAAAKARLDPELRGMPLWESASADVAYLIKLIEDRRGIIVARRLIWGRKPEPQVHEETAGVLEAAIEQTKKEIGVTKKERDRWYQYLREAREKITPIQALTMSVWQEECECGKTKPAGLLKKVGDLLGF